MVIKFPINLEQRLMRLMFQVHQDQPKYRPRSGWFF